MKPARGQKPAGPTQRQLRAGELVRHALVEILREEEFDEEVLRSAPVTVTETPCSSASAKSSSRRISTRAWRTSSPARN